jgi:RecB family exonuclease
VFDRLATVVDGPTASGPWAELCERLLAMAKDLGLASDGLDALRDALDDHALIPDVAGRSLDRARFVAEVETIARDLPRPSRLACPGAVRFATIAEAEGARARVMIVTNLAEGTFPSRESVAAGPDEESSLPVAYSRERLAMLRLIGSAREELILLVPTSDEKGQEKLAAGFVEDIRRRLGPVAGHPAYEDWSGLDPVFRGRPDLAVTPADRRVAALARACVDRETDELLRLVRDPAHRPALEGVAWALALTHTRWRVGHYTEYDGLLRDPKVVARVADALGPDHAFSASQLESFALCPFQFFLRYVLRLDPVDDRPELRVDFASRGDRLHKLLEEIHAAIVAEGAEDWALGERVAAFVRAQLDDAPDDDASDVASALRFLEEIDLRRTLGRYAKEFDDYAKSGPARPEHFEWGFGLDPERPDDPPSAPALTIGEGEHSVRLRGVIDRIDRIDAGFRVIDYKSGHAPRPIEVHTHLRAVQLPLYALAVETHLHGGPVEACDFGYWTLGRDGFSAIKLKKGESWPEFRSRVVAEVVRLVGHLRRGEFPVEPKHQDCRRFCDYRHACRVGQVLDAGKEPVTIVAGG